jgi:hypothetical protein
MTEIQGVKIPNKYTRLNDVELSSIYMEFEGGGRVDLKSIFVNMSFVEDISMSAISGSVFLKDAVNLLNSFPITGHEFIVMEYRTPGIDAEYTKVRFKVVGVSDRVRSDNERVDVYKVKFISEKAAINMSQKVSRSFKGKISDIAKDLYKNYFKDELDTLETKSDFKFIFPRWTPFQCLEWLSLRAIPAKNEKETNYFFFETANGHRFYSLSELAAQKPKVSYYQFPIGSRTEERGPKNFGREFLNVQDIRFMKTMEKMDELMDGAFGSVLYQHDVTTKSWGRKVFDYFKDTNDVRKVAPEKVTRSNTLYTKSPQSLVAFTTKQSGLMGEDFPNVQNHDEWLQQGISSKSLMNTIRVRIRVAGNSALHVGDVINLYIPKTGALDTSEVDWFDEVLSGKYIITTLRNTFTSNEYTTTMMLSKDGYEKAVPDRSTFMGTNNSDNSGLLERR